MAYLDYPGLQRYHGKVQGEIDELKDDLNGVSNLDMAKVFESSSLSAETRIELYLDTAIDAGTAFSVSCDNIQSTDVDDTRCAILFGSGNWSNSQIIERNVPFVFNGSFSNDVEFIYIYASTNYSKSANDTVTLSNFTVKKETKITNFFNSAFGGKTNSYGSMNELYTSDFVQETRVRTANTILADYHLQSCIYVAEKGLYYIAGNTGDGSSVFMSVESLDSIDNPTNTITLQMGHCNDMTYDADTKMIYVVHGGAAEQEGSVTRNGVHVINPNDFSNNYEIVISELTEVYGIEYYDGFFYIREGYTIYKYKLVNNVFVRIGKVSEIPVASIISSVVESVNSGYAVYQNITIKNDVLYFLLGAPDNTTPNKSNINNTIIAKIDLGNGKTTGIIAFKNLNFSECESLFFIDKDAYIVSAQRTYFVDVYKANICAIYSDRMGCKILNANADLNSVLAYGKYACDGSAISTLLNAPSGISDAMDILIEVKQYNIADTVQKITAFYAARPVAEYNRVISSTGAIYGWT